MKVRDLKLCLAEADDDLEVVFDGGQGFLVAEGIRIHEDVSYYPGGREGPCVEILDIPTN